jgi:cation:H+ antiporter
VVGRWEGLLLFVGVVTYTAFSIRQSRRESAAVQAEYAQEFGELPEAPATRWWVNIGLLLLGLGMLALGSRWLVNGAVTFAELLGVNRLVIGLTVVAVGTSLPEVATSVVASIRGERDIAVGNVVGSNLFNIMAVLGLASLLSPNGVQVNQAALALDIPVMTAVAVACLPIFFTGHLIARWEGLLFLGYYVVYTVYLVLDATANRALMPFSVAMAAFVIPITVITLIVITVRAIGEQRRNNLLDKSLT